jgi:MFS transporter, putative metabolite transport protein
MYASAVIPALFVTIGRFSITESAHWLLVRGRHNDARAEVTRLPAREPVYPKIVEFAAAIVVRSRQSFLALFNKANRRATILAAVPWFLQDLGTYGIGMFTPTILAASIGHKTAHVRSLADLIGIREYS